MSKAQKWIVAVLCVCFVAASVFSVVTIASHADHECLEEHCEICLQINHLQNALKQLCAVVVASALAFAAACAVIAIVDIYIFRHLGTLISLKIQMNN